MPYEFNACFKSVHTLSLSICNAGIIERTMYKMYMCSYIFSYNYSRISKPDKLSRQYVL